MYNQAKANFSKSLDYHIRLLKLDYLMHQATADVYQFHFDLAHELWEKEESIGYPIISETDKQAMIKTMYQDLEDTIGGLAKMAAKEKDLGKQNFLLGKLDEAQLLCAKINSLIDNEID